MGLLRVLLALAVLFEHTGGIGGYVMIGGPLAVQCFFIISGFYMGLVLNERYDRPALNRAFYVNRALRIYGIYFFFLAIHLGLFALLQAKGMDTPLAIYGEDRIPVIERIGLGLLNFTVFGQELPMWLRVSEGHLVWSSQFLGSGGDEVFHYMMIPMAWSLSLELTFYAIAPFIARRPAWQIAVVAGLSFAARIIAAAFGWVHDPLSFRFFPFELALFLAGVLAYKAWAANKLRWETGWAKVLALAVPAAILAWPLYLGDWSQDLFFTPPRLALLALVAVGLPAIHGWSRYNRRDRTFGELSFPIYLDHLLVFSLIGVIPVLKTSDTLWTLATVVVSMALAWLVVRMLDSRIEQFRRGLASRAGATEDAAASSAPPRDLSAI